MQDAFTVQKGHIKCIKVQKRSAILSFDFQLSYMCRFLKYA